jgi:hypothetical protein
VTYRRVLHWMIGFIDTLFIQLVTTINYSAIAISTLYSSLTPSSVGVHLPYRSNGFIQVSLSRGSVVG